MQVLKLWDYKVWDGGDRHNHKAYFSLSGLAEHQAKALAGTYDIMDKTEIIIYQSLQEYHDFKSGKLRESALAKLTTEERKALGF